MVDAYARVLAFPEISGGERMNDGLLDAFRHNAWATRQLLDVCRDLTPEQLRATTTGVYGSPIDTFWHIVGAEAGYCYRLSGQRPDWDWRSDDPPGSLDVIAARAEEMAGRWEAFLAEPFDAERLLRYTWEDETPMDVPAGIVLAQALHHGNEHRTQIGTVLTGLGIEPPEHGVWEFGAETGRIRPAS
jgi:uncharacterized damage-inducible protein DinB